MDASIYIAMSATKQNGYNLQVQSNNVANANSTGFKQDNASFNAIYLNETNKVTTTAYSELGGAGINLDRGSFNSTGNDNDIVINGNGYFELQDNQNNTYYTTTLSLLTTKDGGLINSDGGKVLDSAGKQINVDGDKFAVAQNGVVNLTSNNQNIPIAKLKIVNIGDESIVKDQMGRLSVLPDTQTPTNNDPQIIAGFKEESNVNSVDSMAKMIEAQRMFEMSSKLMGVTKNIHKTSNTLIE